MRNPTTSENIGLWTKDETLWIAKQFRRLEESKVPFCKDTGSPDDLQYEQAIRKQLRDIARAGDLAYEQLNVISFIG